MSAAVTIDLAGLACSSRSLSCAHRPCERTDARLSKGGTGSAFSSRASQYCKAPASSRRNGPMSFFLIVARWHELHRPDDTRRQSQEHSRRRRELRASPGRPLIQTGCEVAGDSALRGSVLGDGRAVSQPTRLSSAETHEGGKVAAVAGVCTAGTNTMSSASASSDKRQHSARVCADSVSNCTRVADPSRVRARPQAGLPGLG